MPPKSKKQTSNSEMQDSFFLGMLGENAPRSASVSLFREEIYIHIHDYGRKKHVSLALDEFNYLCIMNQSINSWAEYQKTMISSSYSGFVPGGPACPPTGINTYSPVSPPPPLLSANFLVPANLPGPTRGSFWGDQNHQGESHYC